VLLRGQGVTRRAVAQRNIPAAYPHVLFLDSCVTKQGAGTRVARDYKDWRTIPVVGGESYVVNSSPCHCKICQRKVQEAVNAVHEAQMGTRGVGAETGVATGGDSGADVELDISRATENVMIMQLLHRNTSLQRSLSQSCEELSRFVCMCVYIYMHMQIFDVYIREHFRYLIALKLQLQFVLDTCPYSCT